MRGSEDGYGMRPWLRLEALLSAACAATPSTHQLSHLFHSDSLASSSSNLVVHSPSPSLSSLSSLSTRLDRLLTN